MVKFGTGGWRAVIGEEFTQQNVRLVGEGVYRLLKENNKLDKPVVIGYDRRFISDSAAKWLAEVLVTHGIRVLFLKRSAPTPLIMHTVLKRELYCGLQITASHNPAQYNGIKLIVDEGRDAPLETTNRLEELMAEVDSIPTPIAFHNAVEAGMIEYIHNPFNDFIDAIIAQTDMTAIRERGLRILFDPMHGSGTYALMTILYTARCTVDIIHSDKDAYFGGEMPAPSEKGLLELSRRVVKEGYDLGIALDGDGDRLGIIDRYGHFISANDTLAMLYYYLHEKKGWKGPVVRNGCTTHMLDRIAEDLGEKCYEVPVGFKWISSKIDEVDAVLGGESSGGLTVRGHIHGKDSAYAAVLFVEMMSVMNMDPSEIMGLLNKKYGTSVMVERNYSFLPERKPEILEQLMVRKELPTFSREVEKVSYEDGCKVYFKDGGFVNCRFSGTEPLLRIFAEGKTKDDACDSIESFRQLINI